MAKLSSKNQVPNHNAIIICGFQVIFNINFRYKNQILKIINNCNEIPRLAARNDRVIEGGN